MDKRTSRRLAADAAAKLTEEYMQDASLAIQSSVLADPRYKAAKCVMTYVGVKREVATDLIIEDCLRRGVRLCVPLCEAIASEQGSESDTDRRNFAGKQDANIMHAIEIRNISELCPGKYGIPEPMRWRELEDSLRWQEIADSQCRREFADSQCRQEIADSQCRREIADEAKSCDDAFDPRIVKPNDIDYVVCPCVACDPAGNRLGHGAGYYDRWLAEYRGTRVALCFGEMLQDEIPTDENDVRMDDVITERTERN